MYHAKISIKVTFLFFGFPGLCCCSSFHSALLECRHRHSKEDAEFGFELSLLFREEADEAEDDDDEEDEE